MKYYININGLRTINFDNGENIDGGIFSIESPHIYTNDYEPLAMSTLLAQVLGGYIEKVFVDEGKVYIHVRTQYIISMGRL